MMGTEFGSLQEQQVFLTAESSFQTQYIHFSRVLWAMLGWQEVGWPLSQAQGVGAQASGLGWIALNCFLQCPQGETPEGWGENSWGSYSGARDSGDF